MSRRLRHDEYTVGWICALPVELAAAQEMLDEEHEDLERDDNDENLYSLGSIAGHNAVIVCLPAGRIGNNPAAAVAMQMRATFRGIQFRLMVGIGGGVPSAEADIRLGDVVVSQPHQTFGGVIQYDLGKTTLSGFERTGSLNSPPQILLAAVAQVRANELRGRSRLSQHISKLDRIPKFQRDRAGPDILFEAIYNHEGEQTCDLCNSDRQKTRQPRENDEVVVHYGIIASGNQVMRNGCTRDKLSRELGGILCFEMEAAGLMNSFPCLVIRGICDYADSHKNETWYPYAAGTAAVYAKEVLSRIPTTERAKIHARESTKEYRSMLLQQEADLLDLKHQLLKRELPPQILWQKPIVLNDARGRRFPFHLELIDSAELFVKILKSKFKDLGLRKIKRGEWLLQDHCSGRVLDLAKPWGALIREPGQTLDMSMIFRKQIVSSTHCPTCRSENDGPPETQTECSTCGLVYRRIEEIREIGIQEEDFQTPKRRKGLPAPSPRPKPPRPQDDEDDISHYTRVQVIYTKFRVQTAEGNNMGAVLATLHQQDLENTELLSEYLATVCGLSEEDCLAALKECVTRASSTRGPSVDDAHPAHEKPRIPSVNDEDISLRPFWRPRGFWDDFVDTESEDNILPQGGDTSDVPDPDLEPAPGIALGALRRLTSGFRGPGGFLIRNSPSVEQPGTNKEQHHIDLPSRRNSKSPEILIQPPILPLQGSPRIEKEGQDESWRKGRKIPGLNVQVQYIGLSGVKERLRERKAEKRREEIRKSIGLNYFVESTNVA